MGGGPPRAKVDRGLAIDGVASTCDRMVRRRESRGDRVTNNAYWLPSHPVLDVLRQRRKAGSKPGARSDDFKVGLAVEGGGIRGVVSGAMLCALEDLGCADAIDSVYCASSGAVNGAYYLAGDVWHNMSIYFDHLSTKEFVDFKRFFNGQILNLDYAFDVVVEKIKPLDYEKVLASPIPLKITVTLVDELRTEVASGFVSRAELKEALIASAWLPIATKGTAMFRGERAVDGGALMPHPFRAALDDGCTHVLSLSTRPLKPPRAWRTVPQWIAAQSMNRLKAGLGDRYWAAIAEYRIQRRDLQRWMKEPGDGPYVLDLAPMPWMAEVKRHEHLLGPILTGARGGYEVMFCALEEYDPDLIRDGRVSAVPRLIVKVR